MGARAGDPTFWEAGSLVFHAVAPADPPPSFSSSPPSFLPSLPPRASALHRPPRRRQAAAPKPPQLLPAARSPAPADPTSPERRRRQPRARAARPAHGPGSRSCPALGSGAAGGWGGSAGDDAETQGRRRQGDKLRTWKVTRLSGEVRGRKARAPGAAPAGEGVAARACACCACTASCAPPFHTPPVSCVCCLCADVCTRCVRLGWQPFVSS